VVITLQEITSILLQHDPYRAIKDGLV